MRPPWIATKKVYILDGGSLVIDRSQVLWHIDVGTPVRFPVYSVLIEHPDGLFMYDTGYDLDHVNRVLPFEQPQQTPDQTVPAQLKAAGFDPEQVSFVVNSHFHFDHVGGNKYLTNATTLVNTAELRHAKVPEPFEHLGYSDLSFDFPGTKYERISGDIEIADGLWLFETARARRRRAQAARRRRIGLDEMDRRYLDAIAVKFGGGPVGVETIAAALSEPRDAIEDIIEPYLIQLGFVQRTPRGRLLTSHAFRHLGLAEPRREGPQPNPVRGRGLGWRYEDADGFSHRQLPRGARRRARREREHDRRLSARSRRLRSLSEGQGRRSR